MRHALTMALVVMTLACAGSNKGAGADLCADFEVEVERYWSASIRARVLEHGGELEVERRSGVVNKMDRISEDWVMMRTSTCRDHFVRGLINEQDYAARVRCFDDHLERQRALATALAGGGKLGDLAGGLDTALADPASCVASTTEGQDP